MVNEGVLRTNTANIAGVSILNSPKRVESSSLSGERTPGFYEKLGQDN